MVYQGREVEKQDTKWLLDAFERVVLLAVGILVTFLRALEKAFEDLLG